MVKIAGIWERGWNTPIKEADLWEMIVREFGVDQWYMTPVSGIDHPIVTEMQFMEDVIKDNPKYTVIFVDEKAEKTLDDFVHPEKALYVFGRVGADAHSLFTNVKNNKVKYQAIKIITPMNTALMWPHQIAALILYDRFKKSK